MFNKNKKLYTSDLVLTWSGVLLYFSYFRVKLKLIEKSIWALKGITVLYIAHDKISVSPKDKAVGSNYCKNPI